MRNERDIINTYSFRFFNKPYENCTTEEQKWSRDYGVAEATEVLAAVKLLEGKLKCEE